MTNEPISTQNLRYETLSALLKGAYAKELRARAEIIEIDYVLPTLKDTEEDKRIKEGLVADRDAAESDLKKISIQIMALETLEKKLRPSFKSAQIPEPKPRPAPKTINKGG